MTKIISKSHLPFDDTDNRVHDCPAFPTQAVPYVVKLLLRRLYATSFESGKHVEGRDMIVRVILSIYQGILSPTVEAVDRLYRLTDITFNGVNYVLVNGKPELPAIIPNNLQYSETVRGKLEDIKQAILNQSGGGELDDEMLAELAKIALLLV